MGPDGIENAGSKNELEWFRARGIENAGKLAKDLFAATGDLREMQKVLFSHRNDAAQKDTTGRSLM